MRIAHISDLHTGISETHDRFIAQQLETISGSAVDHLIITGDLTHSGRDSEFQRILRILGDLSFLASERLTVIPGNHDLFSFFFQDFQLMRDLRRKLHRVPGTARAIYRYGFGNYQTDLRRFNDYFEPTFNGSTQIIRFEQDLYPYIKLIGDVAIIVLESNELLPDFRSNALCSNGYVDAAKAREILSHDALQNKIKIVLLHHHLLPTVTVTQHTGRWIASTIRLRNRREIIKLFRQFSVDLVLHGHYHVYRQYHLDDSEITTLNNGDNRNWSTVIIDQGGIDIVNSYL